MVAWQRSAPASGPEGIFVARPGGGRRRRCPLLWKVAPAQDTMNRHLDHRPSSISFGTSDHPSRSFLTVAETIPEAAIDSCMGHGYRLSAVVVDRAGDTVVAQPTLSEILLRSTTPPTSIGYLMQLLTSAGWTCIHRLHRLRMPTMIFVGTDDPIVPPNQWPHPDLTTAEREAG